MVFKRHIPEFAGFWKVWAVYGLHSARVSLSSNTLLK